MTDLERAVRHAIRVKGMATEDAVAAAVLAEPADIPAALAALESREEIRFRSGRVVSGWMLTDLGRTRHAEDVSVQRERLDIPALTITYEGFGILNPVIKTACAEWQLASDDAGRERAVHQIAEAHAEASLCLKQASLQVPRFSGYRGRLEDALNQVLAGDGRFMASPQVDSYHSVWFECHEDFLLTLGISRAEEGST